MKVCVVQPYYSFEYKDTESCFERFLKLIDSCDESMDLIVLPEYSDVMAYAATKAEFDKSVQKYNSIILDKAAKTAVRCGALVFVNAALKTESGYRNTTYGIDSKGRIISKYFKAHPAPSEARPAAYGGRGMDVGYSYEYSEPYVIDVNGVRFGFMTCYDFYFYEAFAKLARQKVDIIIGASHQRTDTKDALEITGRFLCYNTNAYLVRSSVTLGEGSKTGGCSMVVGPDGKMILNMESREGIATAEIDPMAKYYKPAGYNGAQKSHYEYIEQGRRPWLYRNGGSAMIAPDESYPYPRVCAHRGLSSALPENTMPAFGAAVALGAPEIEFDLYKTLDNAFVSVHDKSLDRVSNATGSVGQYTLNELKGFDFGCKFSDKFKGLGIAGFDDILKRFAGQVIMNIHLKPEGDQFTKKDALEIAALIERYDCNNTVYIMSSDVGVHKLFAKAAPHLRRCMGAGKSRWDIVERAIECGCCKLQLFKPYFNKQMIDKAHSHGIVCNLFWADDPKEALEYFNMGIDTVLSNDYLAVSFAVKGLKQYSQSDIKL